MCAVANGLSGFVASVSAGAFYLDYTALVTTILTHVTAAGKNVLRKQMRNGNPFKKRITHVAWVNGIGIRIPKYV